MWPLFFEFCFSTTWAFAWRDQYRAVPAGTDDPDAGPAVCSTSVPRQPLPDLFSAWSALIQFAISPMIERRYEKGIGASLFWIIWFPVVYWLLSLFTTLVSFPKVMLNANAAGRAASPDRE